ncbi:UNVERIFIED_CONTAM: hypothetical protein GTU68_041550 [Idotea baltica]|nr:hypothetical protein [Idotea baltica]
MAIGLSRDRLPIEDISNELEIPKTTIYRWLHQYHNEGKISFEKSPGRRKSTCERSDRLLNRLATIHNLSSGRELLQLWRERVSIQTVYNRLRRAGFRKRRRAIVPFLSPANIAGRLQWSMARAHWRAVWRRVVFSDETRFRRSGNDGRILVWRRVGQRYDPRNVTHRLQAGGGSVHLWGAIWTGGRSDVVVLRAAVNQITYVDTLRQFIQSDDLPDNYIFQQDNAPAHSAAAVSRFLNQAGVRCLPWPSRSPDLNPIEHVWDYMSRKINGRPDLARNLGELEAWVVEEWRRVPQDFIDGLIESMPRRLRAVIEANGRSTKY